MNPLVKIENLSIDFNSSSGAVHALKDINLAIYPQQSIAIVGESGSGKTTLVSAIIGLLSKNSKIIKGKIFFDGQDITATSEKTMRKIRGHQIGLIPQDPTTNLNPVLKIGYQVKEVVKINHPNKNRQEIQELTLKALENVSIDDATKRYKQYPHEFSGGMKQRILISIALSAKPRLLIADEPTSALDVTIQKKTLDHLFQLTTDLKTTLLLITHDLGLAVERSQYLIVMKRGRIVESGPTLELFNNPQHPYTQKLIESSPSILSLRLKGEEGDKGELNKPSGDIEIIKVENISKKFLLRGVNKKEKEFYALKDLSFSVKRGKTLAIVGESGSGKTTMTNIILNLIKPDEGKVFFENRDITNLKGKDLFQLREKMQVVFQNPYGSLDPMYSVFRLIEEPLLIHQSGDKKYRENRVIELLDLVSLSNSMLKRYPNELSGGQRQRVAIARALALNPAVLILDEAVSALDVLVQDQILKLLNSLQEELGLTYIFITHNLAVVKQIADEVLVIKSGAKVEEGPVEKVFSNPKDEYTKELIYSIPGYSKLVLN